jgi:hypothetical protein
MYQPDTWTKPTRDTIVTVNLPDGKKARGALMEVYTRRHHNGLCVQFYVKYDNGRTGMRVRIVDPVTMARWTPRVRTLGTTPEANYKAVPIVARAT